MKDGSKTTDDLVIKFVNAKVNASDIEISDDKKQAKVNLNNLQVNSHHHNQIFRCILPDYSELGFLPKQVMLQVGRE